MQPRHRVALAALAVFVSACSGQPPAPVADPIPALSSAHPCSTPVTSTAESPGGLTLSCATLTVPLDHAGWRPGPRSAGQLTLHVVMTDNADAPRGVLVFLTGGPGQPGMPFASLVVNEILDPAVLRDYRLVLIMHPDRVSRLVLDSVVPHENVDPLHLDAIGRTAEVLRMVCKETACTTDPAQELSEVVRVRHNGPELFDTLTSLSIGAPRLADVPAALHDAVRGDYAKLDEIVAAEQRIQAATAGEFSQGLNVSTLCQDLRGPWGDAATPNTGRAAAIQKAAAALPDAAVFPYDRATAAGNGIAATCQEWPSTPVVPFPAGRDLPAVPVLLLAGDHDLGTPLQWAQQEAARAPQGRLVVIPGAGHAIQVPGNGPMLGRAAVTAFLTR